MTKAKRLGESLQTAIQFVTNSNHRKEEHCGTAISVRICFVYFQKLPETDAADQRYPRDPEELCCLPQAAQLAVVASLHKGKRLAELAWFNSGHTSASSGLSQGFFNQKITSQVFRGV